MEVSTKRDRPSDRPGTPNRAGQAAPPRYSAHATRADVDVRVLIQTERQDDEEKEAGYGHGV